MSGSQTRAQQTLETADAGGDLAPIDLDASGRRLETFPELLEVLTSAPERARPALATRINELLIDMRMPGHEAEESELVMGALEARVLHELIDTRGRSCRKEAVQTMMACGFPHALLLHPDDLSFARTFVEAPPSGAQAVPSADELEPWEAGHRANRTWGAALMGAGQLASVVLSGSDPQVTRRIAAAATLWVLGLAAAMALALTRPKHFNVATFGAFATLLVLAGLLVAMAAGSFSLGLAPVGVGLGLFVSISNLYEDRADPPRAGDWDYRPGARDE